MATLAVFISLGGASYAVVTLPAHSVGTRQLQRGAVTPGALSFPLGVHGLTDRTVQDLRKYRCNAPLPGPRKCRSPSHPGASELPPIPIPGRILHVDLRSPGQLLVTAVVGLSNEGATSTTAQVKLDLVVDGHPLTEDRLVLAGGQRMSAPLQVTTGVSRGRHAVGVGVAASYSSSAPGDVLVAPAALAATVLPRV
jgi:hypothetical protein